MPAKPKAASKTTKATPQPVIDAVIEQITDAAPVEVKQIGEIYMVPHNECVRSVLNARKRQKHTPDEIAELAELIRGQGVLQNLIGYQEKKKGKDTGKIAIVGGGGRLAACQLLIDEGVMPEDYQLPVMMITEDQAVSASVSENSGRVEMHPADEILAIYEMIHNQGKSEETTAFALGLSSLQVRRRLALANVSPKIFELFVNDELRYEALAAYACTSDHAAQEATYNAFRSSWMGNDPSVIRARLLNTSKTFSNDKLASFVGRDAYEKAGGLLQNDLFSDDEDAYILNYDLIISLAQEKADKEAAKYTKKGWSGAVVDLESEYLKSDKFVKLPAHSMRPATPEEKEAIAELEAEKSRMEEEQEKLSDAYYEDDNETEEGQIEFDQKYDAFEDQIQALDTKIKAIEEARQIPREDYKDLAKVVLVLNHKGKLVPHEGYLTVEEHKALRKAEAKQAGTESGEQDDKGAAGFKHSEKLCRSLTAHRTAVLQMHVAKAPAVALCVLAARLVVSHFDDHFSFAGQIRSAVDIQSTRTYLSRDASDMNADPAYVYMTERTEYWASQIPKERKDLFAWLLVQPMETVLELVALCTAQCIDVRKGNDAEQNPFGNQLASALHIDICDHWSVTGENYLMHVKKSRIVDVVSQAVSPEAAAPIAKMPKADAVAAAEKAMVGVRWAPDLIK